MKKYVIEYIAVYKNDGMIKSGDDLFYGTMKECKSRLLDVGAIPFNENNKNALIYYKQYNDAMLQFNILQDVTHTKKERIFKKLNKVWNKK